MSLFGRFVGLALAILCATLLTSPSRGAEDAVNHPHGSTEGFVSVDPQWSLGLQGGNLHGTGIAAQRAGVFDGAMSFAVGLRTKSPAVFVDYLKMFTSDFDGRAMPNDAGYNACRAELTPYLGFGLAGGNGIAARLPFGAQYTMAKDPFNFFGGGALQLGRFKDENNNKFRAALQLYLGARLLL